MVPLPVAAFALSLVKGLMLPSYVTSSNAFPLPFSEKKNKSISRRWNRR